MKWFKTVFILFLLASCSPDESPEDREGIKKERAAHAVLHKVAAQLKQEGKLHPIGTMGQMLHNIEKLGLDFFCYIPTDILEGRKLLVNAVNTMLNEINQKKEIHPYLCRYPFLPRNIEVKFFLFGPKGEKLSEAALSVIKAQDGFLRYNIEHPKKGFITIYQETFDEALERITDPTLPLVAYQPDPEITSEELKEIRKGILFVDGGGSTWGFRENGK